MECNEKTAHLEPSVHLDEIFCSLCDFSGLLYITSYFLFPNIKKKYVQSSVKLRIVFTIKASLPSDSGVPWTGYLYLKSGQCLLSVNLFCFFSSSCLVTRLPLASRDLRFIGQ